MTEEGLEYNEDYINSIKSLGNSLTETKQFLDPKKYYNLTSTINYSIYDSRLNSEKDWLIGIDSVSISHSGDPVGVGWDILGIEDPCIEIFQNGLCEGHDKNDPDPDKKEHWKGGPVWQDTSGTFRWDQLAYTPSDWCPVMYRNAPYLCQLYVKYSLSSYYGDGRKDFEVMHIL